MSYKLALNEIDKFHKTFKAFEEVKNALTTVASLEQAEAEAHERLTSITAALFTETATLNAFRQKALVEKQMLQADSKQEIANYTASIKKKKEARDLEFTKHEQELIKKIEEAEYSINTKVEDLNSISKEIQSKQTELNLLEDKIVQTRKQIKNMLG